MNGDLFVLIKFVHDLFYCLAPRHVTVSTVGVVNNMYRLTSELPVVNLALSLHAPNQSIREKIVPAAVSHRIEKLLDAIDNHIHHHTNKDKAQEYFHPSRHRSGVMIEYILIKSKFLHLYE
jgi:adenine C2-methylase RlmN of 23S rRNA A2503 and tRNA A37